MEVLIDSFHVIAVFWGESCCSVRGQENTKLTAEQETRCITIHLFTYKYVLESFLINRSASWQISLCSCSFICCHKASSMMLPVSPNFSSPLLLLDLEGDGQRNKLTPIYVYCTCCMSEHALKVGVCGWAAPPSCVCTLRYSGCVLSCISLICSLSRSFISSCNSFSSSCFWICSPIICLSLI